MHCVDYTFDSCFSSGRASLKDRADAIAAEFAELAEAHAALPADLLLTVFPAAVRYPESSDQQFASVLDTSAVDRVVATTRRVRETIIALLRQRKLAFQADASTSELAALLAGSKQTTAKLSSTAAAPASPAAPSETPPPGSNSSGQTATRSGSQPSPAAGTASTTATSSDDDYDLALGLALSSSTAEQYAGVFAARTGTMVNNQQVCFAIALLMSLYLKPEVRQWVAAFRFGCMQTSVTMLFATEHITHRVRCLTEAFCTY